LAEEAVGADGFGVEVGVVAVEGVEVVAVGKEPAEAVLFDGLEEDDAYVGEVLLAAADVHAEEDEGAELGVGVVVADGFGAAEGKLFPLVRHGEFA